MVTPSGLIPDQVCAVAETVRTEHPPALGELQAHLLSWNVQQKGPGAGDAEAARAKHEIFLKFRRGSF